MLHPLAKLVAPHQKEALLEALLEAVSDAEIARRAEQVRLRAPGAVTPAELLLQESARVLPKAASFLRRAAIEVRSRLGGCSLPLVSLAAHQVLLVHEAQLAREQRRVAFSPPPAPVSADAVEHTKAAVRRALRVGARLADEIQCLLMKIDRTAPLVQIVAEPAAVAEALERCAEAGAAVLRGGDDALLARATLFGLDGAMVQSWRHEASAIRDAVDEHERALLALRAARPRAPDPVELDDDPWAVGTAAILLSHVVDAFDVGHRVDRRIPQLNSVLHTPTGKRRRRSA